MCLLLTLMRPAMCVIHFQGKVSARLSRLLLGAQCTYLWLFSAGKAWHQQAQNVFRSQIPHCFSLSYLKSSRLMRSSIHDSSMGWDGIYQFHRNHPIHQNHLILAINYGMSIVYWGPVLSWHLCEARAAKQFYGWSTGQSQLLSPHSWPRMHLWASDICVHLWASDKCSSKKPCHLTPTNFHLNVWNILAPF